MFPFAMVICMSSVSQVSVVTAESKKTSGGLNYAEYVTDPTLDSAHYNTNKVFKNLDPSQNHEWLPHGDMLKPRANHNSVFFGDQVYHIAGYAKTFNADGSTGMWFVILKAYFNSPPFLELLIL